MVINFCFSASSTSRMQLFKPSIPSRSSVRRALLNDLPQSGNTLKVFTKPSFACGTSKRKVSIYLIFYLDFTIYEYYRIDSSLRITLYLVEI